MLLCHENKEWDQDLLYPGFPKTDPHDGNTILGFSWREIELLHERYKRTNPMTSSHKDYRDALKAEKKFLKMEQFDTNLIEGEGRTTSTIDSYKVIAMFIKYISN